MDFTNIPNNTTWQDAAGDVTLNFKRVGVEIDKVNNRVDSINTELIDPKDKGYFQSEAVLKAEWPTPKDGYYANVLGEIYTVENGAWVNTGKKAPTPELNLNGYVKANTIYNASQTTGNYAYADKQTARNDVPVEKRALGQILSYKLASGDWVAEQYIGTDVSGWATEGNWKEVGGKLPENVLVAGQGSYSEYIYDGYDIAIELNNGQVIPYNDGVRRTFVNMLPVKAGHLKITADYSSQTFKPGARLFIYDADKNVIHTLKENDVVNNTLEYDIPAKGFITFYLALGDGSYDIRSSYVLEVDTDIDTGHAVKFPDGVNVDLSNIDNMVYTKPSTGNVGVTSDVKGYENKDNANYIDWNTGALKPYNNAGAGTTLYFIDKYPLKAGTTIILTVDKTKYSNNNVAQVCVLDASDKLIKLATLFSGKLTYTADVDSYLRFYTYYNGGTAQPTNNADIRGSLNAELSGSAFEVVVNGEAIKGTIATGSVINYDDVAFDIVPAYIDNRVGSSPVMGGHFIATGDAKTILSAQLEPESDYIIDLGKNNEYTNAGMYGYLYNALPWNLRTGTSTDIKAITKMNVCRRRYIYFSTKGAPDAKYLGLQVAWGGLDFSRKVKVKKLPNGRALRFGSVVSDTKNLRIDHSDSVEPVNIPFPEWVNVNIIGNNMAILNKYERTPMICEYEDSNGHYFKVQSGIARQGASTVNFPKMPMKGKMTTNFGDKFNLKWGKSYARASHHFKSFPYDSTGLRQQTFYSLVYDYLYKRRPYSKRYPNSKPFDPNVSDYRTRFNNEPMYIPYSIPCRMYMNGCFWGIYFMCHSDFCENYGIFESDKNAFVYKGHGLFDTLNLANSWEDWEEIKTDTFMNPDPLEGGKLWSDDTKQALQDLNNWLVNANTAKYKAEFEQHFDLEWQSEYFLVCYFLDAADSFHNNMVLLTYDRQKFYNMFRDGDGWGAFGPHAIIRPYNSDTLTYASTSRLWGRFYPAFTDVVNTKYAELRKDGTFSLETLEKILNKVDQFSYEHRLMDLGQWNYEHTDSAKLYSSISQLLDFMEKRIGFLDGKFGYTG